MHSSRMWMSGSLHMFHEYTFWVVRNSKETQKVIPLYNDV